MNFFTYLRELVCSHQHYKHAAVGYKEVLDVQLNRMESLNMIRDYETEDYDSGMKHVYKCTYECYV